MPRGDGQSDLPLSKHLSLIGKGFRSSLSRYPRDIRASLRRIAHKHDHDADFAEAWKAAPARDGLSALAWLGHNTVLLKHNGKTVLTDPVLSHRIGLRLPGLTIGPERLKPLRVTPLHLPRPDLIVISHAHFDHLDRPTLKALADRRTTVVTARNTRSLIPRGFAHVHELPWDHELRTHDLTVSAHRPNHWGARSAWDRHRGYNSYLFDDDRTRLLYAGDTAFTTNFDPLGPIDLGIFGIGAYNPWIHAHASPEQVLQMAASAKVARLLPVHHSTFKLSDEPADEPLARLLAAAAGTTTPAPTHPQIINAELGKIVVFDADGRVV